MDQIAQAFSSTAQGVPGAAQPITGQELLLRALGAIANPGRAINVPDTTLGRLSGLLSRGVGGIAGAKAEDLQRLRLDPLTRQRGLQQQAIEAIGGIPKPTQQFPISPAPDLTQALPGGARKTLTTGGVVGTAPRAFRSPGEIFRAASPSQKKALLGAPGVLPLFTEKPTQVQLAKDAQLLEVGPGGETKVLATGLPGEPKTRSKFQTTLDVLAQQEGVPDFRSLSKEQKTVILGQAREFDKRADIARIFEEESAKAFLIGKLPRQISEKKLGEFVGRVTLIHRMDDTLDRFKEAFDITGTSFGGAARRELVKLEGLTQITKFIPLKTTQQMNDRERAAIAAINNLVIELTSIVREGRPSDFDAARAIRGLTGRFLDSNRTVFEQLLTTRDRVFKDFQIESEAFRAAGFQLKIPGLPKLRRPGEPEAIQRPQLPDDEDKVE